MIVNNPTDKVLSVMVEGVTYTVEPNASINSVPADAAKYWKTYIHQFITIEPELSDEVRVSDYTEEINGDEEVTEDETTNSDIEDEVVETKTKKNKNK